MPIVFKKFIGDQQKHMVMRDNKITTLKIEVLDLYPTQLGHCPHFNLISSQMMTAGSEFCEISSQTLEYPDSVVKSHLRAAMLLDCVKRVVAGRAVNAEVVMVDLLSPKGFLKSLRHGIKHNYAILLNGRKIYEGEPDIEKAEASLAEAVRRILEA
jgi:hypothetical protein